MSEADNNSITNDPLTAVIVDHTCIEAEFQDNLSPSPQTLASKTIGQIAGTGEQSGVDIPNSVCETDIHDSSSKGPQNLSPQGQVTEGEMVPSSDLNSVKDFHVRNVRICGRPRDLQHEGKILQGED